MWLFREFGPLGNEKVAFYNLLQKESKQRISEPKIQDSEQYSMIPS